MRTVTAYRIEVSLVREEWGDDESSIEQEEYLSILNVMNTTDEETAKLVFKEVDEFGNRRGKKAIEAKEEQA